MLLFCVLGPKWVSHLSIIITLKKKSLCHIGTYMLDLMNIVWYTYLWFLQYFDNKWSKFMLLCPFDLGIYHFDV